MPSEEIAKIMFLKSCKKLRIKKHIMQRAWESLKTEALTVQTIQAKVCEVYFKDKGV